MKSAEFEAELQVAKVYKFHPPAGRRSFLPLSALFLHLAGFLASVLGIGTHTPPHATGLASREEENKKEESQGEEKEVRSGGMRPNISRCARNLTKGCFRLLRDRIFETSLWYAPQRTEPQFPLACSLPYAGSTPAIPEAPITRLLGV